jgi:hypothetical protein
MLSTATRKKANAVARALKKRKVAVRRSITK